MSRRILKVRHRYGGTWSAPSIAAGRNGGRAYDVIIVGSGIGGLASGALLAKRGVRVLVLEQHAVVGGFCHSFVRDHRRYRFDAAVHDISGLGPRGPVRHLLRALGIEDQLEFLRMDHEYFLPDFRLRIPRDPLAFQAVLSRRFPREAMNIAAFFRDVEAVYREIYRDVDLTGGVPRPPQDVEALLEYPRTHPHHMRWLDKSYQAMLDTYFADEELKRFFSVLTGYIGGPASHVPAPLTAIIFGGYYLDGGHYPKGGSQVFADALARVITEHGGAVRTSTLVKRILVEERRAAGVETARGEIVGAPIVVSNADLKQTFLRLVGAEHLDSAFTQYVSGLRMSTTAVSVFLGIDFTPDLAPLTFYLADPSVYVAVPSLVDPSLAPPGHHVLTLITLASSSRARHLFERPGYRKTPEYKAWKAAMAETLIRQAERILPGLSNHIVLKDAATALTFERYALASEGAIYGIDQSPDQMGEYRPHFKTPVQGLYLVGASTFPGAGIEAVVISGVIAAADVCPERRAAVPTLEAA
jgi:phytoene desaturase